ncbi:MAG: hypothetical protein HQM06_13430 [Magnetococcales bacterium]|nr:hypothetical protein [Magnetococcales bacterium]
MKKKHYVKMLIEWMQTQEVMDLKSGVCMCGSQGSVCIEHTHVDTGAIAVSGLMVKTELLLVSEYVNERKKSFSRIAKGKKEKHNPFIALRPGFGSKLKRLENEFGEGFNECL